MIETVSARCTALAALATECASRLGADMERAWRAIAAAVIDDEPILVCGNGGSAAQAGHLVGELVGRYRAERRSLRAVDLSAPAVVTCIGNDYSYEHVFSRQVQAWGAGTLVCLSTSGTSANVVNAADVALSCGLRVVAITGDCGGRGLGALPLTAHVRILSRDTALVQEMTLSLLHSLCEAIDAGLTSGE